MANIWTWAFSLGALQTLDVATTIYALHGKFGTEANPFALFLIHSLGLEAGLIVPKLIGSCVMVAMMAHLSEWPRAAIGAKTATFAIMALVVINNLMVIA